MDEKKKIIIEVSLGVLVLILVAVIVVSALRGNGGTGSSGASTLNATSTGSAPSAPPMVAPTPPATIVPNKGASDTPANVAVPTFQSAGNSSGNVSYRSFTINIDNGAYSPDTVIVKVGDTVNLKMTAVDASYAFTQPEYGFNAAVPRGTTKNIQFEAVNTGEFTFYCGSCGGPSKGPVGHLIVTAD